MELLHQRYSTTANITKGILYVDKIHVCDVLEDVFRNKKIMGETRIPSGKYQITLLKSGTLDKKYKVRFPEFHEGMLLLNAVPNYGGVCIHIGNTKADTEGCLLVGNILPANEDRLSDSQTAYTTLYLKVLAALKRSEKVFITVRDESFILGS